MAAAPDGLDDFMSCVDVDVPTSYKTNTPAEEHVLTIARSFQDKYKVLYTDRKPLLLHATNECGVEKVVCTTLRPTRPKVHWLNLWEECAHFVSSSLIYVPLDPPTELPKTLRSSQAVLQSKRGSSLEYANLLCSLLLGLNYNAYCVSGYASQHLCELDLSQESCPLQAEVEESLMSKPQDRATYHNKKFYGSFVQEEKTLSEEQARQNPEKQKPQKESGGAKTTDPLWGLRVHFWVLVLAGQARVEQDFLIEPLTGKSYPLRHPHFVGVESVWNELNVYINMQDCAWTKGCQDLQWDPEDQEYWHPMINGTITKKELQAQARKHLRGRWRAQPVDPCPYTYFMPPSWCSMIKISNQDLNCLPGGFRVAHFKHAMLEEFIPFFCPDGAVKRLTVYTDQHKSEVKLLKEWFQNRGDLLLERDSSGDFTTEFFYMGHSEYLTFHRFNTTAPEACPTPKACPAPETSSTSEACAAPLPPVPSVTPEREMHFSPFHPDGLVSRVERGNLMIESFKKRRDRLIQRETLFGEQPDSTPASTHPLLMDEELIRRPILKVVEKFQRDRSKEGCEDIAECAFLIAEKRIEVTYHREKGRALPTKMGFRKPSEHDKFTKEKSALQEGPEGKSSTPQMTQLMEKLMKQEEKCIDNVRQSQKKVKYLVQSRAEEQKNLKLEHRVYFNRLPVHMREKKERVMLYGEEMSWLDKQQKDLLASVLMRLKGTTDLNPDQARAMYESCLQDFRSRMIQEALVIQQRTEKDTQALEQTGLEGQKHMKYSDKQELKERIKLSRKQLQIHKELAEYYIPITEHRLQQLLGPCF